MIIPVHGRTGCTCGATGNASINGDQFKTHNGHFASALDKELDILTIKTIKDNGVHNNISFVVHLESEHLSRSTLRVIDHDCGLSKKFTIGQEAELETAEDDVLVESFEQVIEAWESGAIWF